MDTAQKPAAAHGLIERLLIISLRDHCGGFPARQSVAIFDTPGQAALLRRNN
jgi:hypothetical protein